jgi:hypothetical protein
MVFCRLRYRLTLRDLSEIMLWCGSMPTMNAQEVNFAMAQSAEEIYRSSSGDHWTLIRDTGSGCLLVRHEPNLSSSGRVTGADVDESLRAAGRGRLPSNSGRTAFVAALALGLLGHPPTPALQHVSIAAWHTTRQP